MLFRSEDRERPEVSLIIPCRDEQHYIRQTLRHILNVPVEAPYEIIVVDDGSEDGCCNFLRQGELFPPPTAEAYWPYIELLTIPGMGVARARNLGALRARAPYLVFCDAHVIMPPGWLKRLINCLQEGETDAVCPAITLTRPLHYTFYGGTWNENLSWVGITSRPLGLQEIPFAPSGCLAICRDVFKDVGGFEEDFQVWGYEDVEFSLKLWLFGYKVAVHPFVQILHISRTLPKYQSGVHLIHNLLLLAILHFSPCRLNKVIGLLQHCSGFTLNLYQELWDKYYFRRRIYFQRRVFSDHWFGQKFGLLLI
jgi:glycosyltransferase involved in cell wall biosynthesis